MADQISTVSVPCLVIQLNNRQFIFQNNIVGQVMQVPCRLSLLNPIDYWMVPAKDEGMFTTLWPVLMLNGQTAVPQPTFDSFSVTRVQDTQTNYVWWIYGTADDFTNSCSTCCGVTPTPMPGLSGFDIQIAPCSTVCTLAANGIQYESFFGLPTLPAGETYYPYGSYNNVALPSASGSGYSSVALLLAFLNTNWTNLGSPAVTFVWTASADNLTLFATGGNFGDSLCVVVESIVPSP